MAAHRQAPMRIMADEPDPPKAAPKEFQVDGIPLQEFFADRDLDKKLTRRQVRDLLLLMASKGAVHEAMTVLGFELRTYVREQIRQAVEREVERGSGKVTEGGILLP